METVNPTHPSRGTKVAGCLAIIVATFITYLPSMRGDYLWDDAKHAADFAHRDAHSLRDIWLKPGTTPQYYPVTHTSWWLEYKLWGTSSTGYHVTNVLLHAINAILIWRLMAMLEVRGGFLVAMLFAVHPMQVETVAWLSERKNLLSMLFTLSSIIAYWRGRAWVALPLFICALLSKTIACSMPAVMVLLLWWKNGTATRRDWRRLAPFFVVGIALAAVTGAMERFNVGAQGTEWNFGLLARLIIAGQSLCFYVWKLCWPMGLCFNYPRFDAGLNRWINLSFGAVIVGSVALLYVLRRKIGRGPVMGALIFCGTLIPALGFVNLYPMRYSFVADHFVYLSSPALIALLVSLAPRRAVTSVGAIVVIALAALTFRRAAVFADPERLWADTLEKNPDSWLASDHLAIIKMNRHDYVGALELLQRTELLRPQLELLHFTFGRVLLGLGRVDDAIARFERGLEQPWLNQEQRDMARRTVEELRHAQHTMFTEILRGRVVDGAVDYEAIKEEATFDLYVYLDSLANTKVDQLPRGGQLAYCINLYNATVIRVVIEHLQPGFTMSQGHFELFSEPLVNLGGRKISLNDLEKEIHDKFHDPRVYSALVNGARSAPALASRAYRASDLDDALDAAMKRFLLDRPRNTIDGGTKELKLNRTFEWHADDFGGPDKVAEYIGKYLDRDFSGFKVSFAEYSWELNGKKK